MSESQHKITIYLQKRQFKLMKLPPEVRHRILHYLPKSKYIAVYLPGNNGRTPTRVELAVTARASDKLLRQETIMTTIEQTTFAIHSGPGNAKFQKWLGETKLSLASPNYHLAFDVVKSLSFSYFSRFHHQTMPATAKDNDIELMVKCCQLESASMVSVGAELFAYDNTGQYLAKTVQRLCQEYRLDRMLDIWLKKLTLIWRGLGDVTDLERLAAWFRANMSNVDGRPINVVLLSWVPATTRGTQCAARHGQHARQYDQRLFLSDRIGIHDVLYWLVERVNRTNAT